MTGAYHFTSREKLNIELGWESIEKRADILGLNFFHKIHRHETRPLIRNCMPKLDIENTHKIRSRGGYIPFKYYSSKFKNSFFPHISSLWTSLPLNVQCKDLIEFKEYTKNELKWEDRT